MPQKPQKDAKLGGQTGYLVDLATKYFLSHNTKGVTEKELPRAATRSTRPSTRRRSRSSRSRSRRSARPRSSRRSVRTRTRTSSSAARPWTPRTGAIVATYGGEDATKHYTNNADRPVRRSVRRSSRSCWQPPFKTGSATRSSAETRASRSARRQPEEPLQRQQQAEDPEVQRQRLDRTTTARSGSRPTTATRATTPTYDRPPGGDAGVGQLPLRPARHGRRHGQGEGGGHRRRPARTTSPWRAPTSPPSPRYLLAERHPDGRRVLHLRHQRQAAGPFSVTEVKHKGDVVYQHDDGDQARLRRATVADNVTDVLRNVVEKGTGTLRPAAAAARWRARRVPRTATSRPGSSATPRSCRRRSACTGSTTTRRTRSREFLEMFGTGGEEKIHGASFPAQIWQDYMARGAEGHEGRELPEAGAERRAVFGEARAPARRRARRPSKSEEPRRRRRRRPRTPSPSGPVSPDPERDLCAARLGVQEQRRQDERRQRTTAAPRAVPPTDGRPGRTAGPTTATTDGGTTHRRPDGADRGTPRRAPRRDLRTVSRETSAAGALTRAAAPHRCGGPRRVPARTRRGHAGTCAGADGPFMCRDAARPHTAPYGRMCGMPSAEDTSVDQEPSVVPPTRQDEIAAAGSELIGGPAGRWARFGGTC